MYSLEEVVSVDEGKNKREEALLPSTDRVEFEPCKVSLVVVERVVVLVETGKQREY